jgi:hypothetical protein
VSVNTDASTVGFTWPAILYKLFRFCDSPLAYPPIWLSPMMIILRLLFLLPWLFSHLHVGTVIILLGLVPVLLLSIFVICKFHEVITDCMFCTEVSSLSVPYVFLSAAMSDHFVSIIEISFKLHSVVLSINYYLETKEDIMFPTCGQVDILYNP